MSSEARLGKAGSTTKHSQAHYVDMHHCIGTTKHSQAHYVAMHHRIGELMQNFFKPSAQA